MGAVISRVSISDSDSVGEYCGDECRDRSCIRDNYEYEPVATEIINQRNYPGSHAVTNRDDDRLVTTLGCATTGGIFQIRRAAYYFASHWRRHFLVLRSWSVKDFFKNLWAKISRYGTAAIECLKAGGDRSSAYDNLRQSIDNSNGKTLDKLSHGDGRNVEKLGLYEDSNQENVSQPEGELKNATFEKAHFRQALERANKALDGMKSAHGRYQNEVLELRYLIVMVTKMQQAFHDDMTSIKDQTDQVINEYDEKLGTVSIARDLARRKLKAAEDKIRSLNAIITTRNSDLSEARSREHILKERLSCVKSELQDAKRALEAHEKAESKLASQADVHHPEKLPSATETSTRSWIIDYALLHSLYLDALSRATSLEAQNNVLRESAKPIATPNSHGQGLQGRQPRGPVATIKVAPPELIVIGVDVSRSVRDYLPSMMTVYRIILHYTSMNNSLSQLATVAHGCRSPYDVFVGPVARPSRLSPDTLELVQPGGTANYERCLMSARNVLVSNGDCGSSCRKVIILIGHAMEQSQEKSLGALCQRLMQDGIQVHAVTVGSSTKAMAKGDNLGIGWIAEKAGGRDLSESSYLAALPEILQQDG
ncbi:hypothetical protein F5X99DRAFT_422556 [Biscogniauxia marginata]|nr:hypothetical protein F5X99DRAFT_422556 [Biscogniauxia marginata]